MTTPRSKAASLWPLLALIVLFVALKLSGVIAWSWLWICSPLWIPPVLAITLGLILGGHGKRGKS